MHCPACGVEAVQTAAYCHKCGQRLDSVGASDPTDSPSFEGSVSPAGAFQQAAAARRETQPPPEEELWRGGYSPKAMLGAWVISGCVSFAILIGGILLMPKSLFNWLILLVVMLLPWLYCVSVLGFRRMSVHYTLTTQRLIHERGVVRRVHDRIELLDVDDIAFEQGPLERLAGVGTIRITSHDRTDPELVLPGIEEVKRVAGILDDARLAERRRRGLQVEQI